MPEFVFSSASGWLVALAILAGGFYLVVTGKIRVGRDADGRDELITFYREAWNDERAAHAETRKQVGEMLELSRTSAHFLKAAGEVARSGAAQGDGGNASTVA